MCFRPYRRTPHKTLRQESVYVHLDETDLENKLLGRTAPETGETVNQEEVEMEQKREVFEKALNRREDLKRELLEEMREIIKLEISSLKYAKT